MDIGVAFGRVLRRLRKNAGLTQEELGLEAGLQRKFVSSLELGEKQASLATVFKLARPLAVSPGEMVSLVDAELRGDANMPPAVR